MMFTISYCIPCHKRTNDLLATLPSVIMAANQSPPVEIVIVDYGNLQPLAPVLADVAASLQSPNFLTIKEYRGRHFYHMAHARNLSVKAAQGEYIVISATDIILQPNFFTVAREKLAATNASYLRSMTQGYIGLITCRRDLLLRLGGYDERFEFYGPEDKDMLNRLTRTGEKMDTYDLDRLIILIRTPNLQKVANYRLPMGKNEMALLGKQILAENDAKGLIVANEGVVWGEG